MSHIEVRILERDVIALAAQENLTVVETVSLLQTGTLMMADQKAGQQLLDALCIVKRQQVWQ